METEAADQTDANMGQAEPPSSLSWEGFGPIDHSLIDSLWTSPNISYAGEAKIILHALLTEVLKLRAQVQMWSKPQSQPTQQQPAATETDGPNPAADSSPTTMDSPSDAVHKSAYNLVRELEATIRRAWPLEAGTPAAWAEMYRAARELEAQLVALPRPASTTPPTPPSSPSDPPSQPASPAAPSSPCAHVWVATLSPLSKCCRIGCGVYKYRDQILVPVAANPTSTSPKPDTKSSAEVETRGYVQSGFYNTVKPNSPDVPGAWYEIVEHNKSTFLGQHQWHSDQPLPNGVFWHSGT